jgi:hypothetical protein
MMPGWHSAAIVRLGKRVNEESLPYFFPYQAVVFLAASLFGKRACN